MCVFYFFNDLFVADVFFEIKDSEIIFLQKLLSISIYFSPVLAFFPNFLKGIITT